MSRLPPASDISSVFCPPGPTSIRSMSSGKVWFTPVRSTVTFVIVPERPPTVMFDGYGLPAALSLIVIGAAFVNGTMQIRAVVNEDTGELLPTPQVFIPRTRQKYGVFEL